MAGQGRSGVAVSNFGDAPSWHYVAPPARATSDPPLSSSAKAEAGVLSRDVIGNC